MFTPAQERMLLFAAVPCVTPDKVICWMKTKCFDCCDRLQWEDEAIMLQKPAGGYWSVVGKWSGSVWKHGCSVTNVMLLSALHHCFSAASQSLFFSPPPPLPPLSIIISCTLLAWGKKEEAARSADRSHTPHFIGVCVDVYDWRCGDINLFVHCGDPLSL